MLCPSCKNETSVIDSRDIEDAVIRRRRECDGCDYRFTTYERIEPVNIMVIKRSDNIEPYNREKIRKGIALATQKRTVTEQEIDEIVDRVETKLLKYGKGRIASRKIGELVVSELREFDDVAYIRFTSVYKAFKSAKSFQKELTKLSGK